MSLDGSFNGNLKVKWPYSPDLIHFSGYVAWPRKFGSLNMSSSWTTKRIIASSGLLMSNSHPSFHTGFRPLSAVRTTCGGQHAAVNMRRSTRGGQYGATRCNVARNVLGSKLDIFLKYLRKTEIIKHHQLALGLCLL